MSKFYTTTCQAKELATEAKTAKDKAKELSNEVLLKKGEVLRLTEDFKDRKSTRLNSSHLARSRMPSSA